jgi:hypothetical protein
MSDEKAAASEGTATDGGPDGNQGGKDSPVPERVLLPDDAWKRLSMAAKETIYSEILREIYGEIDAAIEAGTFAARDDFHLSWVALKLDEPAWTHLMALQEEMLNRIMDLQATTALRLAEGEGSGKQIAATVAILGFESARERS